MANVDVIGKYPKGLNWVPRKGDKRMVHPPYVKHGTTSYVIERDPLGEIIDIHAQVAIHIGKPKFDGGHHSHQLRKKFTIKRRKSRITIE